MSKATRVVIDGVSYPLDDTTAVDFSEAQSLSTAEKQQARTNIGAGDAADVTAIQTLIGDTALPTTAQTITGAIAEHETDISDIKSAIGTVPSGSNLQGEVDDLKSAISNSNRVIKCVVNGDNLLLFSDLVSNAYYNTAEHESETYSYFSVPVKNGKTYKFNTIARFISRTGEVIAENVGTTGSYTATSDETIYISFYNSGKLNWGMFEDGTDTSVMGTYYEPVLSQSVVKQEPGTSATKVMSQKVVSGMFSGIDDQLRDLSKVVDRRNLLFGAEFHENRFYNKYDQGATSLSYFAVNVTQGKVYRFGSQARYISKAGTNYETYYPANTSYTAPATETLFVTFYNSARADWKMYEYDVENPVDAEMIGTFDIPAISENIAKQETGNSKTALMSQKAITDALKSAMGSIDNETKEYTALDVTWTDGSVGINGDVRTSETLMYSSKIPVSMGDVITRTKDGDSIRIVCAFAGDTAISSVSRDAWGKTWTYDSAAQAAGITDVVISVLKTTAGVLKISTLHEATTKNNIAIRTMRGGNLFRTQSDSMAQNDMLLLPRQSIARNKIYTFSAHVSGSDWGILLAHGPIDNQFASGDYSQGIKVTSSNIIPWTGGIAGVGGTDATPIPHGLTIDSRLCVIITVKNDQTYTVLIMTDTGTFTFNSANHSVSGENWVKNFSGRRGNVYALSLGGTMADCGLAFACPDVEKPIWVFGDSYCSVIDNRWPYWVTSAGCDNYLLNSYPGEASQNAIKDLQVLLNFGTPKYIVWCLGMNDHDTSSAINTDWMTGVETLTGMCEQKGITPILATIPNVTSTSYNNVKKNEWINSHDFRFIDFNKAIGAADEVGATWPTGWLSSDNVHPTIAGARVLAMQALIDVPEFAQP